MHVRHDFAFKLCYFHQWCWSGLGAGHTTNPLGNICSNPGTLGIHHLVTSHTETRVGMQVFM
jgi:hypothetical protein